jgi:hypothetical protein
MSFFKDEGPVAVTPVLSSKKPVRRPGLPAATPPKLRRNSDYAAQGNDGTFVHGPVTVDESSFSRF